MADKNTIYKVLINRKLLDTLYNLIKSFENGFYVGDL